MNLKAYIEHILPAVKVFISCPIIRADNIRANHVLRQLDKDLKLYCDVVDNDEIDDSCLGQKGLHLNAKGSTRLATNFISQMKRI